MKIKQKLSIMTLFLICMILFLPLLLPVVVAWDDNGTHLCPQAEGQYNPQLCSDGAGGAIVVWMDHRLLSYNNLYAQRIDSTGRILWSSSGIRVAFAAGEQDFPKIVSDGVGGAIIVWRDHRAGPMAIYAQRINSVGNRLWSSNGSEVRAAIGLNIWMYDIEICSDDENGAIIVWRQRKTASSSNYDLYAQRINATGDIQWDSNGILICNATNNRVDNQICIDGDGGAIITWRDNRGGGQGIYAQRVNSFGTPQWTLNGTVICNEIGVQEVPQIVYDNESGAIVAWEDSRAGGNFGIYGQRINSSGDAQWIANGTAISNLPSYKEGIAFTQVANNSFILAWMDARSGIYAEIYAQRINLSGDAQWFPNGTAIYTNINSGDWIRICSDGLGGAIMAWYDYRGSTQDLYAQRVNSEGESQWATNGTAVCTATGGQMWHELVNNAPGRAIVVWEDTRVSSDIYALGLGIPGESPEGIPGFGLFLVLISLLALVYLIKLKKPI
ncbi:MAG: hypothetical protein HWN65_03700 [Candidatus Helarchaeota archaeon]|nr:hypothetical protein [Candidatus Helarchaeota archaeon]